MDRYPQYEGGIVVSDPRSFSHPIPLWSVTGINSVNQDFTPRRHYARLGADECPTGRPSKQNAIESHWRA
jgi:hypothetical protein